MARSMSDFKPRNTPRQEQCVSWCSSVVFERVVRCVPRGVDMAPSHLTDPPPRPASESVRLESWKAIAAYLNRSVTTVQRWEQEERLPVHRLLHSKSGSVYALTDELDAWRRQRDGGGKDKDNGKDN